MTRLRFIGAWTGSVGVGLLFGGAASGAYLAGIANQSVVAVVVVGTVALLSIVDRRGRPGRVSPLQAGVIGAIGATMPFVASGALATAATGAGWLLVFLGVTLQALSRERGATT